MSRLNVVRKILIRNSNLISSLRISKALEIGRRFNCPLILYITLAHSAYLAGAQHRLMSPSRR